MQYGVAKSILVLLALLVAGSIFGLAPTCGFGTTCDGASRAAHSGSSASGSRV